jgi:hypothetical protein
MLSADSALSKKRLKPDSSTLGKKYKLMGITKSAKFLL